MMSSAPCSVPTRSCARSADTMPSTAVLPRCHSRPSDRSGPGHRVPVGRLRLSARERSGRGPGDGLRAEERLTSVRIGDAGGEGFAGAVGVAVHHNSRGGQFFDHVGKRMPRALDCADVVGGLLERVVAGVDVVRRRAASDVHAGVAVPHEGGPRDAHVTYIPADPRSESIVSAEGVVANAHNVDGVADAVYVAPEGFEKKSHRTPPRAIALAVTRLADWRGRARPRSTPCYLVSGCHEWSSCFVSKPPRSRSTQRRAGAEEPEVHGDGGDANESADVSMPAGGATSGARDDSDGGRGVDAHL